MRPVEKDDKRNADGTPKKYKPYGMAKKPLTDNIGKYCSYCEIHASRAALEVEHIKHKNGYPSKQYRYDNFLLACKSCNTVKGQKRFKFSSIYLPHLNNIMMVIDIKAGGVISVKSGLRAQKRTMATAFIDLVGLDRNPYHPRYSEKDDRWEERLTAYDLAGKKLIKYNAGKLDEDDVADYAKLIGFFSVWMTIFSKHSRVQKALIAAFTGTHTGSFDATGKPRNRNGTTP